MAIAVTRTKAALLATIKIRIAARIKKCRLRSPSTFCVARDPSRTIFRPTVIVACCIWRHFPSSFLVGRAMIAFRCIVCLGYGDAMIQYHPPCSDQFLDLVIATEGTASPDVLTRGSILPPKTDAIFSNWSSIEAALEQRPYDPPFGCIEALIPCCSNNCPRTSLGSLHLFPSVSDLHSTLPNTPEQLIS